MSHTEFNEDIGTARGVMFDLDGTLILSDPDLGGYQVLPGAVETLETLRHKDIPFLALTNGSAYPAARQAPRLRALGLPIEDRNLFTPNSVAGHIFREDGIGRVLVLGTEGVAEALRAEGVSVALPGDRDTTACEAVYVAWHPDCTMEHIHAAADAVLNGARFFTASVIAARSPGPSRG